MPSVEIAYAPKTISLFRRIGLEDCCVSMHQLDASSIRTLMWCTWIGRAAVNERITQAMETDIVPSAKRNFDFTGAAAPRVKTPAEARA